MRWRSRDGCIQNISGPKKNMNHETCDDQILMDLLDLLMNMHSKVWRPNGFAMGRGETLHP